MKTAPLVVADIALVVKVSSQSEPGTLYDVKIFADGRTACACKDHYFRGTYRGDNRYACKHVRAALAAVSNTPSLVG